MKNVFFLIFMSVIVLSCSDNKAYKISGTIEDLDGKQVFLKKIEDGRPVDVDTVTIENNGFSFEGSVDQADIYFLFFESAMGNLPFVLDNTNIEVTAYKDSIPVSVIKGSADNDLAMNYVKTIKNFNNEFKDLNLELAEARKTNDTLFIQSFQSKRMKLMAERDSITKSYITKNTNSVFGLIILENLFMRGQYSEDEAQEIFSNYSETSKTSGPGTRLKGMFDAIYATKIGAIAPEFSGPNPDGEVISLGEIKGKVTIIDFWAAWCGPCRRENPNMVKLYKNYHDKGLNMIGVSLDGNQRQGDAKQAWIDAIVKDSLTWPQISNLKYFDDPIAKQYNIKAIPATFILDSEGKIVAKNLRGKPLEDKVAELLSVE
jgi:peroxiredoxin